MLVVATWRTGEQYVDDELLHELTIGPDASLGAARAAQRGGHGRGGPQPPRGADDAFASACYRTTSGNPLLLRQLLRALEAERVRPGRLARRHRPGDRLARRVQHGADAASAGCRRATGTVARAIAVLGDGASLPVVAAADRALRRR